MVTTEHAPLTKDQLIDLERSVAALDIRLQCIQWGLQRGTASSLAKRFRSFMRPTQGNQFMSTVCNQHIRSNTKLVNHDRSSA